MRQIFCALLCGSLLLTLASCNAKNTVSINDAVMLAYEGDTPMTAFDISFSEKWCAETIQTYLDLYEPLTVRKGDVLSLDIDGAVFAAEAFRVCYIDENGNEVKYRGSIALDKNSFSQDKILIETDWWYDDPEFAGQHSVFSYWISVSLPNEDHPTRIYYLRVLFE